MKSTTQPRTKPSVQERDVDIKNRVFKKCENFIFLFRFQRILLIFYIFLQISFFLYFFVFLGCSSNECLGAYIHCKILDLLGIKRKMRRNLGTVQSIDARDAFIFGAKEFFGAAMCSEYVFLDMSDKCWQDVAICMHDQLSKIDQSSITSKMLMKEHSLLLGNVYTPPNWPPRQWMGMGAYLVPRQWESDLNLDFHRCVDFGIGKPSRLVHWVTGHPPFKLARNINGDIEVHMIKNDKVLFHFIYHHDNILF